MLYSTDQDNGSFFRAKIMADNPAVDKYDVKYSGTRDYEDGVPSSRISGGGPMSSKEKEKRKQSSTAKPTPVLKRLVESDEEYNGDEVDEDENEDEDSEEMTLMSLVASMESRDKAAAPVPLDTLQNLHSSPGFCKACTTGRHIAHTCKKRGTRSGGNRKVHLLDDAGVIISTYVSMKKAAEKNHITVQDLKKCLVGKKTTTAGGLRFREADATSPSLSSRSSSDSMLSESPVVSESAGDLELDGVRPVVPDADLLDASSSPTSPPSPLSSVVSSFHGVEWNEKEKKWEAKILIRRVGLRALGLFDSEITAALAYDKAALRHGRSLNFAIDDEVDQDEAEASFDWSSDTSASFESKESIKRPPSPLEQHPALRKKVSKKRATNAANNQSLLLLALLDKSSEQSKEFQTTSPRLVARRVPAKPPAKQQQQQQQQRANQSASNAFDVVDVGGGRRSTKGAVKIKAVDDAPNLSVLRRQRDSMQVQCRTDSTMVDSDEQFNSSSSSRRVRFCFGDEREASTTKLEPTPTGTTLAEGIEGRVSFTLLFARALLEESPMDMQFDSDGKILEVGGTVRKLQWQFRRFGLLVCIEPLQTSAEVSVKIIGRFSHILISHLELLKAYHTASGASAADVYHVQLAVSANEVERLIQNGAYHNVGRVFMYSLLQRQPVPSAIASPLFCAALMDIDIIRGTNPLRLTEKELIFETQRCSVGLDWLMNGLSSDSIIQTASSGERISLASLSFNGLEDEEEITLENREEKLRAALGYILIDQRREIIDSISSGFSLNGEMVAFRDSLKLFSHTERKQLISGTENIDAAEFVSILQGVWPEEDEDIMDEADLELNLDLLIRVLNSNEFSQHLTGLLRFITGAP